MHRHVADLLARHLAHPEAYHGPALAQSQDPQLWFIGATATVLEGAGGEGSGTEVRKKHGEEEE